MGNVHRLPEHTFVRVEPESGTVVLFKTADDTPGGTRETFAVRLTKEQFQQLSAFVNGELKAIAAANAKDDPTIPTGHVPIGEGANKFKDSPRGLAHDPSVPHAGFGPVVVPDSLVGATVEASAVPTVGAALQNQDAAKAELDVEAAENEGMVHVNTEAAPDIGERVPGECVYLPDTEGVEADVTVTGAAFAGEILFDNDEQMVTVPGAEAGHPSEVLTFEEYAQRYPNWPQPQAADTSEGGGNETGPDSDSTVEGGEDTQTGADSTAAA